MMGDYHVRFCERLRGETPLCLLDKKKSINRLVKIMNIKEIAEEILGRKILDDEGIHRLKIEECEESLKIKIPIILKDFYGLLGNNFLFTKGYQEFAKLDELFINDNKLVFLQENQGVVYWAIDMKDSKTIYQTTNQNFDEKVEWYKEEFELEKFVEMLIYFQCVMSDDYSHSESESGFEHFASLDADYYYKNKETKTYIDNLSQEYKRVINGNGLTIYWKPDSIIMYFVNQEGELSDMILNRTKNDLELEKLVEEFGFGEL